MERPQLYWSVVSKERSFECVFAVVFLVVLLAIFLVIFFSEACLVTLRHVEGLELALGGRTVCRTRSRACLLSDWDWSSSGR